LPSSQDGPHVFGHRKQVKPSESFPHQQQLRGSESGAKFESILKSLKSTRNIEQSLIIRKHKYFGIGERFESIFKNLKPTRNIEQHLRMTTASN
jgi:hypothetical protein